MKQFSWKRYRKNDWRNHILYVLVSLLIICCNPDKSDQYRSVKKNPDAINLSIDPAKVNSIDAKLLIEDAKLIKLEKNAESLIGMVNEVMVNLNNIYLLDRLSASIYCFGINGDFKFKISKQGRGPNEYIDSETFCIDEMNKEIILYERARKRVHRYDAIKGNLNGIIDLGIYVEQITKGKDKFFLISDEYDKNKLQVYSQNMQKVLDQYFPFDPKKNDFTSPRIISNFDGNILYSQPFDDIIYQINEGFLTPAYIINFGSYRIDPGFFKGDLSQIKQKENEFLTRKYASSIHFLLETEKYVSFRYPHGRIFHLVFISKENNKYLDIDNICIQGTEITLPYPVATYGNYFVSIIYPSEVTTGGSEGATLNDKLTSEGLFSQLQQLKQDDNAAILIYRIKNI